MLDAPSIICRVVRPIVGPVVAAPGDVLTAWPGHPTLALYVLDGTCTTVKHSSPREEGALYSDLLHWFLDARIQMPEASQKALLSRSA